MKKKILLYSMSLLYTGAGCWHFIRPAKYRAIMPSYLPYSLQLVYVSGAAEILLGLLLLFTCTRKLAAWGIILLLITVFPANVQMLLNYLALHHRFTWIAIARLPLQLLLVWWAWQFTFFQRSKA